MSPLPEKGLGIGLRPRTGLYRLGLNHNQLDARLEADHRTILRLKFPGGAIHRLERATAHDKLRQNFAVPRTYQKPPLKPIGENRRYLNPLIS